MNEQERTLPKFTPFNGRDSAAIYRVHRELQGDELPLKNSNELFTRLWKTFRLGFGDKVRESTDET